MPITPTPQQYSLYTTLLNSSGVEAVFSFIPPHGRRLAPNEQLTVAGNIVDRLAGKTSNRQFKALERALASGKLTIIYTPAPYVYDGTTKVQNIGVKAGAVGMIDPIYYNPPGGGVFAEADAEDARAAAPARR